MPDENGKLIEADVPILNEHLARHSPDGSLTCPVTGQRVPVAQWQISDRLCMLAMSGMGLTADASQLTPLICCTSPAGGIVFLDALGVGLLEKARAH